MAPIKEVVFCGAKGQAKVLRECNDHMNIELVALIDNVESLVSPFADVPILYEKAGLNS